MCDPITLTGIALSGASAAASGMAQSKVAKAREGAMAAERTRQQKLDAEAQALNLQSQDRYQNFEQQQTDKAKSLGDYFTEQRTAPEAPGAVSEGDITAPTSSSNITVNEEKKQRAKAAASTDAQGRALGDLRSFGDLLGGISTLQARDAMKIGQIGGFKKSSTGVNALELDAANGQGNGIKAFGDILGTLGTAVTAKGLSGSFTPKAPAVAAGSMAAGRAADIASVPGYAAPASSGFNLFRIFG